MEQTKTRKYYVEVGCQGWYVAQSNWEEDKNKCVKLASKIKKAIKVKRNPQKLIESFKKHWDFMDNSFDFDGITSNDLCCDIMYADFDELGAYGDIEIEENIF